MKTIAVSCKLYSKNFQIFSRFPAGISREMGYIFPFPTGNSKHRKCATLHMWRDWTRTFLDMGPHSVVR